MIGAIVIILAVLLAIIFYLAVAKLYKRRQLAVFKRDLPGLNGPVGLGAYASLLKQQIINADRRKVDLNILSMKIAERMKHQPCSNHTYDGPGVQWFPGFKIGNGCVHLAFFKHKDWRVAAYYANTSVDQISDLVYNLLGHWIRLAHGVESVSIIIAIRHHRLQVR